MDMDLTHTCYLRVLAVFDIHELGTITSSASLSPALGPYQSDMYTHTVHAKDDVLDDVYLILFDSSARRT